MRELEPGSLLSGRVGGYPWLDFLLANVDLSQAAAYLVPLQVRDAEEPVQCRGQSSESQMTGWLPCTARVTPCLLLGIHAKCTILFSVM